MNCPLCGNSFEEFSYACKGCPVNKDCKLICCPNCGYKFPNESKIVNFINNIFKKERKNATT